MSTRRTEPEACGNLDLPVRADALGADRADFRLYGRAEGHHADAPNGAIRCHRSQQRGSFVRPGQVADGDADLYRSSGDLFWLVGPSTCSTSEPMTCAACGAGWTRKKYRHSVPRPAYFASSWRAWKPGKPGPAGIDLVSRSVAARHRVDGRARAERMRTPVSTSIFPRDASSSISSARRKFWTTGSITSTTRPR